MTKTFKHLIEGKPLRLRRSPIDDVKKAIEIAKKMAGNHTGAVKEIEKIQKGLSNHIRVKDALRTANEATEHPRNIRFWDSRAKQVAIDTIKNPSKSLLGGPTAAEAEKVLKVKFGYTDAQIKKLKEEVPANATGTAVAGTGDDSSTVVVKKKKEQQSKLMKRITDSIDKAIPDIKKEEDEITTRKNQLKELAKNRNV